MTTDGRPLDSINRAIARLLRLNASRAAFARSAAVAGVPLTQPAYVLLRAVVERGPLPMSQLAGLAQMDSGMAARQVNRLVDDSLVRRRADPTDGRVTLIEPTARGRRTATALYDVRLRHLQRSLGGWSERDLRTFDRLLTRFVADMAATPYDE